MASVSGSGVSTPRGSIPLSDPQTLTQHLGALLHAAVVPTLSPIDTHDDIVRKRALVTALLGCTVGAVLSIIPYTTWKWEHTLQQYGILSWIVNATFLYFVLCYTKRAGTGSLAAYTLAAIAVVGPVDLYQAAALRGVRCWPMCVILVDILLICDAPDWLTLGVMVGVVLWIVLTQMEFLVRFGLFDLPGLPSYGERRALTECDAPPCSDGVGVAEGTLIAVIVFVMDFMLTRGFKRQVRAQQRALHDSMAIAQEVAYALAEYDLDAAERYLKKHGRRLPEGWQAIYGELLTNLRSYKPYLPHALFRTKSDTHSTADVEGRVDLNVDVDDVTTTGCSDTAMSSTVLSNKTDTMSECAAYTPPLQPLVKQPTFIRNRTNAVPTVSRVRVDDKRMSLLAVTLDIRPDGDSYPRDHSTMLAHVIEAVKGARGSVDYFHGERIYASFNAFSVAYSHAQSAVAAALSVCTACGTGDSGPCCAVATGLGRVGTLGTATMLSPSIVGGMPQMLVGLQETAGLLNEAIVCNRACYVDACVQYPMRILLHRVVVGGGFGTWRRDVVRDTASGGREGAPPCEVVYCVERQMASAMAQLRAVDCQEWMYEVAAGDVWTMYNEAGRLYLGEGTAAAEAYMRENDLEAGRVQLFAQEVVGAMFVDMRTRCTPIGVASLGTSWLCRTSGSAVDGGTGPLGRASAGSAASLELLS